MAKYTLEGVCDIEAECPTCGNDLLCTDCDQSEIEEHIGHEADVPEDLPTNTTQTLIEQLRRLYEDALDDGRYHDKDFLSGLVQWMQSR